MAYFANSAINRLYAHSGLQSFAENAGNAFAFVYFIHAGFSVPQVLMALAGLLLVRLCFRQLVIPFTTAYGIRAGLVLGTLVVALAYLPLARVETADRWLALYLMLAAFGEAFYWTCFHAAVASLGDSQARGAQTSTIQTLYALTNVVAPLAGGFSLAWLGPKAAFLLAALIQLLAVWPVLLLPAMPRSQRRITRDDARIAALSYFGDGVMAGGQAFAWALALFITLGEKFQAYGLAQAGAAICGAVMALLLGRLIDAGHPKRSAAIAVAVMALTVLLKASAFGTPWAALIALAAGAIALPIYNSAYNARLYTVAKASGDALGFHVAGEGGWDIGTAISSLAGAALIHFGFSFFWAILLGLPGLAIVGFMLAHSYQKDEPSLRV